ncbi:Conserved putative secreted protein [Amycolatopsis japonica]|uniref:Conserved putative secreted protein n=1 Tax=Amycolatopsis japonica TaxID=208439 RepID=A0A075V3P7_9PSEU|nr:Conserved putative secreted protein [Amycolatopsis japonica]
MIRRVFAGVVAIGAAVLAGPSTGFAQQPQPDPGVTVQLNDDTAYELGLVNKYVHGDANVALAQCPGGDGMKAPTSTTFSSPVLTIGKYDYGPLIGVPANVSADVELKAGTAPGSYPLTVNCNGKSYTATFSVPPRQVSAVPAGAAHAGDGSMAS